jgi:hypothetical protein
MKQWYDLVPGARDASPIHAPLTDSCLTVPFSRPSLPPSQFTGLL